MRDKVKKFIVEQGLITAGDVVIVGVSGGPDSMALLHLLHGLMRELEGRIIAAHFNHQLREEAGEEEELVRGYCRKQGIEFYCRSQDIRNKARQERKSLEEAGRDARYQFFRDLMQETGGTKMATAHHQDDRAEGVLLNLIRGSGIKGLRSIMPENGNLIRPLLCVRRAEIMDYLAENSVPYCLDPSNNETYYLRNRIRRQLLPCLEKNFNPRMVENLNRLADIARDENEAMEQQSSILWPQVLIRQDPGKLILNIQKLQGFHPAYQRRLLLHALGLLQGMSGWSIADVEYIRELLARPGSGRQIKLRQDLVAQVNYKELHLGKPDAKAPAYCYPVKVPGEVYIKEIDCTLVFTIIAAGQDMPKTKAACLDYDKLEKDLVIRSRQPGDYFYPTGLNGKKKIKDFFIDIKLPRAERDFYPLLAAEKGNIYALLGLRIDQRGAAGPDSRNILVVQKR